MKSVHLFKRFLFQLLQRFGQKGVVEIVLVVLHLRPSIPCLLPGNASLKESVKLMVELPEQLELGGDFKHHGQILLILIGQVFLLFHNQILMVPNEGCLFLLGHPFSGLPLLLGAFAGTTPTPFTALIALAFDAIFDVAHPIEDELIALFDHVKNAQLMLDFCPPFLQAVFIQR